MVGAVEDRHSMRKEVGYGVERFHGSPRTAGQIHYDRLAADAGGGARENCARSFLAAGGSHLFGETGDQTIDYGLRGFRSHVARPDSGAACGQDQVGAIGIGGLFKKRFDGCAVVGEHCGRYNFPA